MAIYKEANPQLSIPFAQFFENFWARATIASSSNWHNEIAEDE